MQSSKNGDRGGRLACHTQYPPLIALNLGNYFILHKTQGHATARVRKS